MVNAVIELPRYPNWQFSLKSLMFVTTLVAVSAALVHIALALAILAIPLIAAALARTILVLGRERPTDDAHVRPKLFATFCNSMFLIVALISICLAATVLSGVTAALIAMTVLRRLLAVVSRRILPVAARAGKLLIVMWNARAEIVSRLKPGAMLDSLQAWSLVGTLSLMGMSRRLFRQCCCCPLRTAAVSSVHSSTRTDPL
jgi:hypothetical protein